MGEPRLEEAPVPHHTCECGARYRFPDESVGKRAKCAKCGAVFTLRRQQDDGIIAIAEDPESEAAAPPVRPKPGPDDEGWIDVSHGLPPSLSSAGTDEGELDDTSFPSEGAFGRRFGSDVAWAFLFPASLGNLLVFLIVWAVMAVLPFFTGVTLGMMFLMGLLMFAAHVAVQGWYCAVRLEIIRTAASGETDLPELGVPSALWDDAVVPIAQWLGSWLVALAPAIAYRIIGLIQGWAAPGVGWRLLRDGLSGLLVNGTSGDRILDVLIWTGISFWPMLVLCVALGGFSTVSRPDLMIGAMVRTFPTYAVVVLLLIGTVAFQTFVVAAAAGAVMTGGGGPFALPFGTALTAWVMTIGAGVYFDFVVMMVIGLYYHHCKHRLGWSWG
jgi:hypothetical protein